MASLQELLAQEGFERRKFPKNRKQVKLRDKIAPDESIALPIYICRGDRRSLDFSKQKLDKSSTRRTSSVFSSSKRVDSDSGRTNFNSRRDEPAIDEVATRAVISILSGYTGRYLKDESFRESIRQKCNSCLLRKTKEDLDNGIFTNMELGIQSIDKLVENQGNKNELRVKALSNSIQLLTIVASLNSNKSKNDSTCGTPNSHLSACAQLYLSIVYKMEKNDRISARHLLQVFCDAPFLARTHLLPDLWEHFFLPHLLHLKVWYNKELEFVSSSDYGENKKKLKALTKVYDEHMDLGTFQFAMYYKEWIKVGAKAPPVPTVPLPPRPGYGLSRRISSDSYTWNSPTNKNLYQAVFGPTVQPQALWSLEEEEKVCRDEEHYNNCNYAHKKKGSQRRSSGQYFRDSKTEFRPEAQKSDYLGFFACRNVPTECLVNGKYVGRNNSVKTEENPYFVSNDLSRAIATICSSDNLAECEIAIRVFTKTWLDSHGDPVTEKALSKSHVIEGILEVLFASNDDEILELAISVLAELVSRNNMIRQIMLNSDPQLEIFTRLLRSSSLFLKSAVLLYLLKPMAKQMISVDWVPLVLRVLEFGDQLQTLFTVRCSPHDAAFYFLDQLLTCFDEDRNLENARQVVSDGGLSLLIKRIENGDAISRNKTASIICACIRADGSCRNYLAENLDKASVLQLIVQENQSNSDGSAITLLTELLCLNRRTHIAKFIDGLKGGWNGLNTMHILLVYLQRAPPEDRPLVAAILLQLDLLGDPLKCSIYREEAVEAIIEALDCELCNKRVQEQTTRALLMLGGRFSYSGEAITGKWLLQQAGFHESSDDPFQDNDFVYDMMYLNEEEEATENWQRKAAIVLLKNGNKRFLGALSDSIAKGIPSLAKASLITVAWISSFLHSVGDENMQSMACSILIPQLLESLNYDKDIEERALASYSLLALTKCSECVTMLSSLDQEFVGCLRNLSLVTWTASDLISIVTTTSKHQYLELEDTPTRT